MTDSESKRTEYLRAQMSLGERVEVLERQVDRLKDRKVTVDWASMTTDKIDDLARRVAEIEGREHHFAGTDNDQSRHIADLQRRVAELEKDGALHALHGQAAGWGAEWCDVRELARLRRIEEAARVVDSWDPILCGVNDLGMLADLHKLTLALRAALDSEPKR